MPSFSAVLRYSLGDGSYMAVFFVVMHGSLSGEYRGTSLIRKRPPLGPYSRTMPS